jgi:hypothetical protein
MVIKDRSWWPWRLGLCSGGGHKIPLSVAMASQSVSSIEPWEEEVPDWFVLRWLVEHRKAANVIELLRDDPELAHYDYGGKTLLHIAAEAGDLDTVQAVYSFAPFAIEKCEIGTGRYPLHCAAQPTYLEGVRRSELIDTRWNLDVLRFLSRKFPDALSERDQSGCLPLHYGCFADMAVVQLLSRHGWLCDWGNNQRDLLLHLVAEYGTYLNIQRVYRLCPEAVLVRNSRSYLPLHCIVRSRFMDLRGLDFLIDRRPELLLGNIGELRNCFGYDQKQKQIEAAFETWLDFFGHIDVCGRIKSCYV